MRDSILTIPISEVFEPRDGCPFCRMRDMLETRCVEYIMGAAMMEPDIRIETNKQGFCKTHYDLMLQCKNRLSIALMLSTHLEEVKKDILEKKYLFKNNKQKLYNLARVNDDCFVCSQIDKNMKSLLVTFFEMYSKSDEFKKMFESQDCICLPHYEMVVSYSKEKLSKSLQNDFEKNCSKLVIEHLDTLIQDTCHFSQMYDYRNTGKNADWGNSKDSIERAIKFLTSR